MPTYQYACRSCGHRFEVVQSMADEPLTTCPECGGELRKVYAPPAIAFRGSGFYATDHGKRAATSEDGAGTASKGKERPTKGKEGSTQEKEGSAAKGSDASGEGGKRSDVGSGSKGGAGTGTATSPKPKEKR